MFKEFLRDLFSLLSHSIRLKGMQKCSKNILEENENGTNLHIKYRGYFHIFPAAGDICWKNIGILKRYASKLTCIVSSSEKAFNRQGKLCWTIYAKKQLWVWTHTLGTDCLGSNPGSITYCTLERYVNSLMFCICKMEIILASMP